MEKVKYMRTAWISKLFIKGQIVNVLGFAGHMVFDTATLLCHVQKNRYGCGCVPINL
jgi:hypothetical protein